MIGEIVRNVFARERLDEAPVQKPTSPSRPSLARMLFAPEPLAMEPEAPARARRSGLLRALFAREPLPEDGADAPPGPSRRARWLRWLVAPESLDPPP